jgi:hypothetical protein
MTKQLSLHEFEILSAYLDGELTAQEQSRLERALEHSSELQQALDELRRTRIILRSASRLRAPRNFTLTPEMVGGLKPARKSFFGFNALRFSSALASVLLVLTIVGEWFAFSGPLAAPAALESGPASQEETMPPEAALLPLATSEPAGLRQSAPGAPEEPAAKDFEPQLETPLPTAEISMFAQPVDEATPQEPNTLEAPMVGSALVAETPTPEAMMAQETPGEAPAVEAPLPLPEQPLESLAQAQPTAPGGSEVVAQPTAPGGGEIVAMQPAMPQETSNPRLPWRIAQGILLIMALVTALGAFIVRRSYRSKTA